MWVGLPSHLKAPKRKHRFAERKAVFPKTERQLLPGLPACYSPRWAMACWPQVMQWRSQIAESWREGKRPHLCHASAGTGCCRGSTLHALSPGRVSGLARACATWSSSWSQALNADCGVRWVCI